MKMKVVMKTVTAFILQFLFSFPTLALPAPTSSDENVRFCQDLDLSEKFGPIRNQGESEACFAFSAADFLGFILNVEQKNMVSGYDILTNFMALDQDEYVESLKAILFTDTWNLDKVELAYEGLPPLERLKGGSPEATLGKVLRDGFVCREEEVPSQHFLNDPRKMPLNYKETFIVDQVAADVGPSADPDGNKATQAMRERVQRRCQTKIPLPAGIELRSTYARHHTAPEMKNHILLSLFLGKPVYLNYDRCLLETCRRGNSISHSSIAVGKRIKNNKCQIRIRDSYSHRCVKKKYGVECNRGHYWVNLDDLSHRLLSVITISNDGSGE